ncbi:BAF_collapsed_G0049300.mRNA.1.CDS.1 [Saccharomyces cerevisiae]|nr:CFA_G0047960.mRNA.1.CDS.1 [Saccharomyces cerevisiae]CAI5321292.1 BAF_HP2_G0048180.mRNA.1.CDS.1 [Saccharomyces cerevisiae]CAI6732377.1 BAF_HP2_G0048180.mRNA.1.CDS.1 [Saccharomyces cerevisiae]CAI6766458.1 BAF_HP1_G0048070.mRNA.1.CDS.1 [Saccharomyces cerevisiae]CAI7336247.1 BAF_collapsed_G0049300.mRNA.1.CDS.1 [Saccharomyces cerevisiae]
MSDEDNNYDDFMLSDDEGMESIEMEEETDDEDKQNIEINEDNSQDDQDRGAARHKQHEQGTFEKHDRVEDICERIFEQGQALKEDERYKEARDLFLKIYYKEEFSSDESIESLMTWKFKSLIEILRLRALQLYFQKNGAQDLVLQILEDTATMSVFLQRIDFQIDGNIFELLSDTFEVLAPKWERVFLFDIEKVDRENMICKIEFQKNFMDQFQWILRKPGKDCKLQNLQRIIRKKIFIAVVWYQRLTMGNVFTPEISSQIEILVKDNECSSFEENNDLESVSMLLQYYILEYMNTAQINNRRLFKKCIDFFEMLISKSLTFSQESGLMVIIYTSKIVFILDSDSENDLSFALMRYYDRKEELKNMFLYILKHLEEMGKLRERDITSSFHKFILSGFIFTSMILEAISTDKINPFGFEQVKIALGSPIVNVLEDVYRCFAQLELRQLNASISLIPELSVVLSGIIQDIYYLAQTLKLWRKIARLYSCISISDIISMLQISDDNEITRDDLLTILMRSIMKNRSVVYFKLDLTSDLVYFGDENKVMLPRCSKEEFRLMISPKDEETTEKARLIDFEYVNDVAIYNNPTRIRTKSSKEFFNTLRKSRETVKLPRVSNQSNEDTFLPSYMKFSNKYLELCKLASNNLE